MPLLQVVSTVATSVCAAVRVGRASLLPLHTWHGHHSSQRLWCAWWGMASGLLHHLDWKRAGLSMGHPHTQRGRVSTFNIGCPFRLVGHVARVRKLTRFPWSVRVSQRVSHNGALACPNVAKLTCLFSTDALSAIHPDKKVRATTMKVRAGGRKSVRRPTPACGVVVRRTAIQIHGRCIKEIGAPRRSLATVLPHPSFPPLDAALCK